MKIIIALVFACTVSISPAYCNVASKPGTVDANKPSTRRFQEYLQLMCNQLDGYYTWEDGLPKTETGSIFFLLGQKGSWREDLATIPDFVNYINGLKLNLTCFTDQLDPKIIHFQFGLRPGDRAVFDQKITLSHEGSPIDLLRKIVALTDRRVQESGSLPLMGDIQTQQVFGPITLTLREIMSNYLPLSKYTRMLWKSEINPFDKSVIWVRTFGPILGAVDIREFGLSPNEDVNFSKGEAAYYLLPFNDDNTHRALDYIVAQMQEKQPIQVRWAMFYLGKYKVSSAVPTLLRYIDYEYAPSPIYDERYPMLQALEGIGASAGDGSLKQLVTEPKPLRLELLSRVVIAVNGIPQSKVLVDAAAAKIADRGQLATLHNAFNRAIIPGPTATLPQTPPRHREVAKTDQIDPNIPR